VIPAGTRQPDLASPAFKANPFPYYAQLREVSPICEVRLSLRRTAWLIARYDDALAVLRDPRFLKSPSITEGAGSGLLRWMPATLRALSRNMLDLDEPDHRRLRELVQKAFTPAMVDGMRERVTAVCDSLLDRLEIADRPDLIRDYALPLPVTIIAEMLGVPEHQRRDFQRWSSAIVAADASTLHLLRAIPSSLAFLRFLRKLVRRKRIDPGGDLLSRLTQVEEAGDHLSEDELLSMAFLLLIAGHETTVNLIGNGMLALLEHPAELARLRDDPRLLRSAVEEMLRFSNPVPMATERYTREDVVMSGVRIPRGSLVFVLLASANRDPSAFSDADSFDIAREPNRHLAFGFGTHFCLGAPLARAEGQIAIARLLQRFASLSLAVPSTKLKWRRGLILRGLDALPVRLGGIRPAART
jgi:cytochrome P450 PksS